MENITVVSGQKADCLVEIGYTHEGDARIAKIIVLITDSGEKELRFLNEDDLPKGDEFMKEKIIMGILASEYSGGESKDGQRVTRIE